jgi:hypothetical protein
MLNAVLFSKTLVPVSQIIQYDIPEYHNPSNLCHGTLKAQTTNTSRTDAVIAESLIMFLCAVYSVYGMPYLADLGSEADAVSHSILQTALNTGSNISKPYYMVPNQELQQVRVTR